MALRWMAVGLLVVTLATAAAAETVMWQAAAVAAPAGAVVDGVRTYSPERDIRVQEHRRRRDGAVSWSKALPLSDTLSLSTVVRRERSLDGFGLSIHRRGERNGYSWNWFERESAREFGSRRIPGRLAVTTRKEAGYEELESVEFLDDVALRYLDDTRRPPGIYSHEVVIRRGSVLRVAAPPMCPLP